MGKMISALMFAVVVGFTMAALAAATPFDDLDKNKDGKLSQSETSKIENLDFAKADTNHDGMLDRSEYDAAVS